jgi:hypothetical protein
VVVFFRYNNLSKSVLNVEVKKRHIENKCTKCFCIFWILKSSLYFPNFAAPMQTCYTATPLVDLLWERGRGRALVRFVLYTCTDYWPIFTYYVLLMPAGLRPHVLAETIHPWTNKMDHASLLQIRKGILIFWISSGVCKSTRSCWSIFSFQTIITKEGEKKQTLSRYRFPVCPHWLLPHATSGKRVFGLDPLVPASIWAGTKGPATSPQIWPPAREALVPARYEPLVPDWDTNRD